MLNELKKIFREKEALSHSKSLSEATQKLAAYTKILAIFTIFLVILAAAQVYLAINTGISIQRQNEIMDELAYPQPRFDIDPIRIRETLTHGKNYFATWRVLNRSQIPLFLKSEYNVVLECDNNKYFIGSAHEIEIAESDSADPLLFSEYRKYQLNQEITVIPESYNECYLYLEIYDRIIEDINGSSKKEKVEFVE